MESKDLQTRLLYPARLQIKIEGEIRSFPDKKKVKGWKKIFNANGKERKLG